MTKIRKLSPTGDRATGLDKIGLSFPELVVSGDPQEAAQIYYDRNLGSADIGIWTSDPGVVRFRSYPFDELCIIVEGTVRLRDVEGSEESYRPGDLFIIPQGWAGDWIMDAPLRKFYVELKD